ncbi:MAG: arginine repressor [Clostridiaceae bacterium]|jgi:transcriptional regulator of arginine metabolism|nr:arginine repressor [Clostridiaceae bacterium]
MKYNRHAKILEIIEQNVIETQEELVEKLRLEGMDITQATISRDIKELKLAKVLDESGVSRYASVTKNENTVSTKLLRVFSEAYVSSDYANNIVVVKTLPGMAQAVASVIDSLRWSDIIGSIAGDDTIMIVCRAEKIAEKLVEEFSKMANK